MDDLCIGPIPKHLRAFAWYAPHQAWLRDEGRIHHDPIEAAPARANLTRAYLAGAYLTDADLTDADLASANLTRAYLAGANLAGANLTGAYLASANLTRAYLAGAYLAGAYLTGADLTRANLTRAYLAGAYLTDADLTDADLAGANLTDADLADAMGLSKSIAGGAQQAPLQDIPVLPHIDATILRAIEQPGCSLDMSTWHMCETTHCRAGWTVHLAGKRGRELEKQFGTPRAASLIYRASRPDKPAPHWYATTKRALEDLRRCAAEDPLPQGEGQK